MTLIERLLDVKIRFLVQPLRFCGFLCIARSFS